MLRSEWSVLLVPRARFTTAMKDNSEDNHRPTKPTLSLRAGRKAFPFTAVCTYVCAVPEYLEMAMCDYLAILRDKWRCYAISRDLMRRYAPCVP